MTMLFNDQFDESPPFSGIHPGPAEMKIVSLCHDLLARKLVKFQHINIIKDAQVILGDVAKELEKPDEPN